MAVIALVYITERNIFDAIRQISGMLCYYVISVFSCLTLYNLFFHPLRNFPGPLGAKVSRFWLSAKVFRKRNAFEYIHSPHKPHGPFVRVGPSELSIAHPQAVEIIHGQKSKCTKSAWYDISRPVISLQTFRDRYLHVARRRIWSAAFSDRQLCGYEQRIRVHRRKLMNYIWSVEGKLIDMTKWFKLYSFDVMGDLAFGQGFDMLDSSREHWAVKLLADGFKPCGYMLPTGQTIPDIASAMLAPLEGRTPTKYDLDLLTGDSQLIVVAGSDTTGTTMAAILYELIRHPYHIGKLRTELAPYKPDDTTGEYQNDGIAHLSHLNGIVNEALRLHPPVPTFLPRKTPPEGIVIDGVYIPRNTTVWCPQYVLGRDEAVYTEPENFIPERWYKFPAMVKENTSNCIGKPPALSNIRTTIAQLVMTFDFALAPSDDGSKFNADSTEQFVLRKGELNLVFERRA
ncbi:cytochrome P450 [Aspergillus stella-maris]|uniref:cytochrome P450 n=1 Tax=Aspergillus stella-maris TaxID=1810926 RepID=UPI003CCD1D07